jgi:hypothetical protein
MPVSRVLSLVRSVGVGVAAAFLFASTLTGTTDEETVRDLATDDSLQGLGRVRSDDRRPGSGGYPSQAIPYGTSLSLEICADTGVGYAQER